MLGRFFRRGRFGLGCSFHGGKSILVYFFRGWFYPGAVFPGGSSMRGETLCYNTGLTQRGLDNQMRSDVRLTNNTWTRYWHWQSLTAFTKCILSCFGVNLHPSYQMNIFFVCSRGDPVLAKDMNLRIQGISSNNSLCLRFNMTLTTRNVSIWTKSFIYNLPKVWN